MNYSDQFDFANPYNNVGTDQSFTGGYLPQQQLPQQQNYLQSILGALGGGAKSALQSFSTQAPGQEGQNGIFGGNALGNMLQAGSGIFGAYNGYQNMQTARDQLNHTRSLDAANYANQAKLLNSELEYRQNRRIQNAAGSGVAVDSADTYLDKYGAKTNL